MALQDTLDQPDKVETQSDPTLTPRYNITGSTFTLAGYVRRVEVTTTSTWTAATKAACENYKTAYTGTGGISITQQNNVVNSWQLVLVEQTIETTWEPEA